MIILGIETSCDETAASVIKIKRGRGYPHFFILSNIVASQIKIHQKYGGVVPELAARHHLKNIIPIIDQAIKKAKIKPKNIDLISVTSHPGLITSLLVGLEAAKTLAYLWQKPLAKVNHLKAHIYVNYLKNKKIKFPALGLIVSGGHTELVLMKDKFSFKKIGQTLDDAAGECFDKIAKMLDIGYPGGPIIEKLAKKGNPSAYNLPRPMINSQDFNFSFSGLKTAMLYKLRDLKKKKKNIKKLIPDLAAGTQQAIIDVLLKKTIKAAKKYKVKTIMLAGGVAANQQLRKQLQEKINYYLPTTHYLTPNTQFCTDNAAMVAIAGYFQTLNKKFRTIQKDKS
ncbi:tRNA (adenosine(37)-N6)-threonylcarbamoyltransferase complex transferase subunit TsaD [bacterium]|nr:tRNA (adenosine(37)-N6)-threonylcarbamoyltransferase complex transferase subunit TsaD [bacterium]